MGFFDFLKRKELKEIADLQQHLSRYSSIINVEEEAARRLRELNFVEGEKKLEFVELDAKVRELSTEYSSAVEVYKNLRKAVALFESKLDLIEYGVYEPVYDFERSDDYRNEQNKIIEQQKFMISEDLAAICTTQWTVGDSEAKGRAMVKRYKKLMLRAFNGECDALIAKVKWNNVNQMKERMSKLFDAINKLGEAMQIHISTPYLSLKQNELILEYEYQAKRQKEKEEMRAVQEELREEEKARREFEQAQREAEKEALNYEKALEKARIEVELATGQKQLKLQAKIELLEQELLRAQEQKARAISMAQQTKRGHVYVISNIGSFGENVYKIGMTRRLEPIDRVRELGDASVPFQFDIHAMIYCDDAPSLENALHRAFTNKKVNMLNYRKEFFHVTLDEIESTMSEIGVDAEFSRLPEAMEFRETVAILERMKNQQSAISLEEQIASEFRATLLPA